MQRFGNREHLLGVAVYDRRGNVVAITSELGKVLTATPPDVTHAMETGHGESSFARLGDDRVHIFALPLHRQDEIVGGLAVVHDVELHPRAKPSHLARSIPQSAGPGLPHRLHYAADRALEHRRARSLAPRSGCARFAWAEFPRASKCPTWICSGRWRGK